VTDLKNKVVLVTGAGKGRGRLLAQALATQGARIAANDISPVNVEQVVDQINAQGGQARAYIEDVAKKLGAQYVIKQVEEDFGQLDILINHASVEPHVPLLEIDEWDWHRVLDVNLTGAFLMMQTAGRIMQTRGGGVIINLVSTPERLSSQGAETGAAFVASMRGLEGLTRQAARELNPYGIRVYAVDTAGDQVVDRVMALLAGEKEEP
jgi:NAD(P)-dependent dehydrogenase (short-subunit alcohol dehydrogenase family)